MTTLNVICAVIAAALLAYLTLALLKPESLS